VVIARFPAVDGIAADVIESVLAHAPTLGPGRLVCVDGPAGSGKTTLGAAVRRAARDLLPADGTVGLVHMDNVYAGWAGLETGMATVATSVVEPLRHGRPGRYRRFDWHAMAFAEEHVVNPVDVLVIEGVGSASAAYDDAITCLVWVEAPSDVRLDRGLARDGERLRDHWLQWREVEEAMFTRERTRQRADVVVDGVSATRL
jgi:uridine kinase